MNPSRERRIRSLWASGLSRDKIARRVHAGGNQVQRIINQARQDPELRLAHDIGIRARRPNKKGKGKPRLEIEIPQNAITSNLVQLPGIIPETLSTYQYPFPKGQSKRDGRNWVRWIRRNYPNHPLEDIRIRSVKL